MGFNCKGCVIERESVKTQVIEDKRVFAGSSRLSIPRYNACALHDWNAKGQDRWRQLGLSNSTRNSNNPSNPPKPEPKIARTNHSDGWCWVAAHRTRHLRFGWRVSSPKTRATRPEHITKKF